MEEGNSDVGDINILVPEVCMAIDDTCTEQNTNEVTTNQEQNMIKELNGDIIDIDGEESKDSTAEKNIDTAHEEQENLNPNQIPEIYTLEEMNVFQQLFGPGQQAVQFLRMHCTACNNHLGSAPNKQHRRYLHPLLKVLICKDCYDFYGSGDFDKDEDGSELYCRWCGQGGKVLCCAQCPYVFCQRCIRTNLGKRKLEMVKESDDWTCFVCRPEQVINLRVTCRALYDFVQEEIRLASESNQPERLNIDHSICCKNRNVAPKRKPFDAADNSYDVMLDEEIFPKKKKIKASILSHMLSNTNTNENGSSYRNFSATTPPKAWEPSEVEDEVVCTPDLSLLMDDEMSSLQTPSCSPPPVSSQPSYCAVGYTPACPSLEPIIPNQNTVSDVNTGKDAEVQFVGQTRIVNTKSALPSKICTNKSNTGYILPNKPTVVFNATTNRPLTINSKNFKSVTPKTYQASSRVPNNQHVVTVLNNHNNSIIDTTMPTKLVPGLKYDWFEKATQFAAKVNQNLSTRLCSLSQEQTKVMSLEDLARIHNSLQEILSNSINSLMQIRKNLRSDFITGLKKLKFCKFPDIPEPQPAFEDDVIIVDSNIASNSAVLNGCDENRPHPYIKVKPVSELLDSSVITIPDDYFTPDNIVSVENSQVVVNKDAVVPSMESVSGDKLLNDANNEILTEPNTSTENGANVQTSNYVNADKELSEISESLNPETVSLIKKALVESKFEIIVNDNLKTKVENILHSELKRMLSVRVLLQTNFGSGTPKSHPCKGFTPMRITRLEEQDIEEILSSSIVLNTSKRRAFDSSFSTFVASISKGSDKNNENSNETQLSNDEENDGRDSCNKTYDPMCMSSLRKANVQTVNENEESSHGPQTTDSGIDVDGEQSLSNGIINSQDE